MTIRRRVNKEIARVVRRVVYHGRLRRLLHNPQVPERSSEECVLFFAPEAGIEPHFSTVCLAARTLQELGHKVFVTQCYECFPRCPVMGASALPGRATQRDKAKMCRNCAISSLEALRSLKLPPLELGAYVTPELHAAADAALAGAPENLLDFEYAGVRFGKLCCVDISLALKRSQFATIRGDERQQWLDYIGASLRAYLAVDRILAELPVRAVVYFNDYSLMLAARLAAKKHAVPATTISLAYHCNIDRRKVGLYSEVSPVHSEKLLGEWPKWRNLALGPDRLREIGDDILHRLGGNGHTIYSPQRQTAGPSVWQQLNLAKEKQLVAAFTSSNDELIACRMMLQGSGIEAPATERGPFSSQIQWLQSVVEYSRERRDLQFVVRVHPREGGERRNGRTSDHLPQLRAALTEFPDNCRIVWPEDKISSYDLGEAADLVLVSWSSMGQEMARLGAPVLQAFNTFGSPCPRDKFARFADSAADYFDLLSQMLKEPVELESLLLAWRWQNLMYLDTTLDFSDVRGKVAPQTSEPFCLSRQATALESVILGRREVAEINHERLLGSQSPLAPAQERAALLGQLRRIVHFFFTGEDRELQAPPSWEHSPDGEVSYWFDGCGYRRRSPMISRLANLMLHEASSAAKAA